MKRFVQLRSFLPQQSDCFAELALIEQSPSDEHAEVALQLLGEQFLVGAAEHAAVADQKVTVLHLEVTVVVADEPMHDDVVELAHQPVVHVLLGFLLST